MAARIVCGLSLNFPSPRLQPKQELPVLCRCCGHDPGVLLALSCTERTCRPDFGSFLRRSPNRYRSVVLSGSWRGPRIADRRSDAFVGCGTACSRRPFRPSSHGCSGNRRKASLLGNWGTSWPAPRAERASRPSLQVLCCSFQEFEVLAECADPAVAAITQNASYSSGLVVVVDLDGGIMLAYCAAAALGLHK